MFVLLAALCFGCASAAPDFETLVYGASSAGIAAAIAASANGTRAVALVEVLNITGGMLSAGGLGLNDQLDSSFNAFFISGIAREYNDRVAAFYNGSEALIPDMYVAQAVVDAMLASRASITILRGCALQSAARAGVTLSAVTIQCGVASAPRALSAAVYIDASYSGDLLVASGVPYTFGREAAATYGETLGGALAVGAGDGEDDFEGDIPAAGSDGALLPYIERGPLPPPGAADGRLMAYGHRACVTNDAKLRIPFPPPPGYNRSDHELLLRTILARGGGGAPYTLSDFTALIPYSHPVAKAGRTKYMLCCGGWPVNGDAVTLNAGYVGAGVSAAQRAALDAAHTRYLLGALHFLATDAAVPAPTRADASQYGLCGDEWAGAAPVPHWPPQLYVREGARLVNDAVLTQTTLVTPRGKPDGIAVGAWYFDKHVVTRIADAAGDARNEGHFRASTTYAGRGDAWCRHRADACQNVSTEWYDVPLSALLPRRADATNLVVPVGLAASSVAFSSARIESMLMGTGAAAGVVARLAAAAGVAVQDVAVAAVQDVLVSEFAAAVHGPPTRSAPQQTLQRELGASR